MVSENLLNYIRVQQAHGYTMGQIKGFLKKNGYSSQIIEEHLAYLTPKKKPIQTVILIGGFIALLLIVGGIVFASWFFSQPVCGNGILEVDETPENCCIDAGCLGDQSCTDNQCVDPICGECQYARGSSCFDYECCNDFECGTGFTCQLHRCKEVVCTYCQFIEDNVCVDYECCEDSECGLDSFCVNNACESMSCGSCQYVKEKQCVDYTCCADSDCDDGNVTTRDACTNKGTLNALCKHVPFEACEQNSDCDDGLNSTANFCAIDTKECAYPTITACKDKDNYCPQGCEYKDDDDCEAVDLCVVDSDCDDDKDSTIDTCEGTPKSCENEKITECTDADDYCPSSCTWETDDDCKIPPYDLIVGSTLTLQSIGDDFQFYEPDCAKMQVLVFDISHNFSTDLRNLEYDIYVDDVLANGEYNTFTYLREESSLYDTTFATSQVQAYVEFKGSVAGKTIKIEVKNSKDEFDNTNNEVSKTFPETKMDLYMGAQRYNETDEVYEIDIFRTFEITECPDFDIVVYEGINILPHTFAGFDELEGKIFITHTSSIMNISIDPSNIVDETDETNNAKSY